MTGRGTADRLAGEAEIVALLAPLTARFPGAFALTDDCAVWAPEPGCEVVLKSDAIAEGVHFLAGDPAEDIGWKALAVNVSDLVAKGARPRVYLMSLAFPEAPARAWLEAFARGLAAAQEAFGIVLAGGDTDRRPGPLAITIAAMGEVAAGQMVRRGAMRPGDRLYVSGTLGDAALGLALATAPERAAEQAAAWGIGAEAAAGLVARYRRPAPRLALAPVLAAHARAAMDLSDGLVKDLGRMAAAARCGARVEAARLPMSGAVAAALARDPAVRDKVAAGGDDYEVLAAVATERAAAFETAARAAGIAVTDVGTAIAGQGVDLLDADGRVVALTRTGYDHF